MPISFAVEKAPPVVLTEDFESFDLSENWPVGDWDKANVSTNRFVITGAHPHSGVRDLLVSPEPAGDAVLVWSFPKAEISLLDATFWAWPNSCVFPSTGWGFGTSPILTLTNRAMKIRTNSSPQAAAPGNIESYNGSTWDIISVGDPIPASDFFKMRIVADLTADTFKLYIDDVQQGGDHAFISPQTQIDSFYIDITDGQGGIQTEFDDFNILFSS